MFGPTSSLQYYRTVQKTKNNKLSEKLDKHVMRSKKYIQIDTMDAFVHLIFHYVYFDIYFLLLITCLCFSCSLDLLLF